MGGSGNFYFDRAVFDAELKSRLPDVPEELRSYFEDVMNQRERAVMLITRRNRLNGRIQSLEGSADSDSHSSEIEALREEKAQVDADFESVKAECFAVERIYRFQRLEYLVSQAHPRFRNEARSLLENERDLSEALEDKLKESIEAGKRAHECHEMAQLAGSLGDETMTKSLLADADAAREVYARLLAEQEELKARVSAVKEEVAAKLKGPWSLNGPG